MDPQGNPQQPATSRLTAWFARLAPDVLATIARFPLAVGFGALEALLLLALINDWVDTGPDAIWIRLFVGLGTAAIVATAGHLYSEAHPQNPRAGSVLTYLAPVAVVALTLIDNDAIVALPALPLAAFMWLSVSAFSADWRNGDRELTQNRFWWLNHRAATSAAIAVLGFALIALGILAIERSLTLLFGLRTHEFFYNYVLPIFGAFIVPVYWLSTLPKLDEYEAAELTQPDFLSRAIGFLGQFVLTPLLLVYAVILLAYAAQIVVTGTVPVGVLGWMVLLFVVTGAANWLLLHPPFMREKPLVGLFRRIWFWVTLIPLGLYCLAVGIRIDAYGLTPERIWLMVGGTWAVLLTLLFLLPRTRDIRLIPLLAGILLALASVGPWNYLNLPRFEQGWRLETALAAARNETGWTWTEPTAARAQSAIDYLLESRDARPRLERILAAYNVEQTDDKLNRFGVFAALDLPETAASDRGRSMFLNAPLPLALDMSASPFLLGRIDLFAPGKTEIGRYKLALADNQVTLTRPDATTASVDLMAWFNAQRDGALSDPVLELGEGGTKLVVIVESVDRSALNTENRFTIDRLSGTLFSVAPPPSSPDR